MGNIGAGFSIP